MEKVQPAYQPTRVNLQQLKSENQAPRQQPAAAAPSASGADVVGGGYQPIGKVDIAAIRRQAAESGQTKDDRPVPVKGSYEPVGKVDIAAIRARAQKPDEQPARSPAAAPEPVSLPERPAVGDGAERLTSLPKPKVANKFGGGPSFGGTKPPLPSGPSSAAAAAPVGIASRTFADEGGKTPAQVWAERKAKERGGAPPPAPADTRPIASQLSGQPSGGNEWKSGYSGKSWAPVQTVQDKAAPEVADVRANEPAEAAAPPSHVSDAREQFAREPSPAPPIPQASRPVPVPVAAPIPVPGLPTNAPEPEEEEHDRQQELPTPPPQPRSPTPPTPPVRESSPIQVAMPVGRGVADAHDEQQSPPPVMPVQSMQEAVPDERDLEETHDLGRAAAETEADIAEHHQQSQGQASGGIRAQVQFDYEKAEDNEIELREGEFVTDIEMVDKDWWLGVNARGEHGLFPGNYVEVVEEGAGGAGGGAAAHEYEPEPEPVPEPEPAPRPVPAAPAPAAAAPAAAAPAATQGHTATALYDYEAAEDNEISFPENAKIENVVSSPAP